MNHQPIRIAVVGPESSGKSTLCAALAKALHTVWVPEYARSYLEEQHKINVDGQGELLAIASGQLEAENAWTPLANQYLICDTDLHMVRIWSETMYRQCAHAILASIAIRKYDLYLLSFPDVPWEPDPLRGYPDYKDRHYFYLHYLDMVTNSGLPFAIIRGTEAERLKAALEAIIQVTGNHSS